jgi:protein-tyrosine phosphatase
VTAIVRPPSAEMAVLMVCLGNICRSPTAEAMLRHKLLAAGLHERVAVDSAGTEGYHVGDPPDERSQRHAGRRGIDLSTLRARRVVEQDFERFDLLLAMDQANHRELLQRCPPGLESRVRLLLDFATQPHGRCEVPDPFYGGAAGFEDVLDLVDDACEGLLAHLRAQLEGTS